VIRVNPAKRRSTGNRVDRFALRDGLTSNIVVPILEDREGNLWVGTNLGLDRFRAANAVAAPGIPLTSLAGYQAASGGEGIYVASGDTLFRAYPNRPADTLARLAVPPSLLYADRGGTVWVSSDDGQKRLTGTRLARASFPAPVRGAISSETQDRDGANWIVVNGRELFKQVRGNWQRVSLPATPRIDVIRQVLADAENRIWLNCGARLIMVHGDRVEAFSERDGLSIGRIEIIATGPDELLVGGDFGLSRFDGRHFQTLRSERYPVLARVSGILQTVRGDSWINGISGVVRVATRDLDAAFANPGHGLPYKVFDLGDGLPGVAQQDGYEPTVVGDAAGRIWFVTSHGVAWIDPSRLARNALPPPITIRSLTADGREYPFRPRLDLPAGSENVQIDYTALSLSAPERVRFRYRLEGVDRAWVDPGARRQAFYTKLAPGLYRFHIIAANNDGVWNRAGADLSFRIRPYFTQSIWFAMLCGLLFVAALWMIYLLRLRQATARIRGRLEERLTERERIARELHDTLLQGFQGLVLRFQAVAESIPTAHLARQKLEDALVRAEQVLVEGRDRILDLRATEEPSDLSQTFVAAGARLQLEPSASFRVVVEGRPRALHPVVLDEISRIGDEALFNARRHAQARSIEVVIVYHPRELRVLFRDDGVGIDPETLTAGGKTGHFGLVGMRERAKRIQGQLIVASRHGAGPQVGLTIPARVAYIGGARSWWFSRIRRMLKGEA
jgi:signal transduction histidine kinase